MCSLHLPYLFERSQKKTCPSHHILRSTFQQIQSRRKATLLTHSLTHSLKKTDRSSTKTHNHKRALLQSIPKTKANAPPDKLLSIASNIHCNKPPLTCISNPLITAILAPLVKNPYIHTISTDLSVVTRNSIHPCPSPNTFLDFDFHQQCEQSQSTEKSIPVLVTISNTTSCLRSSFPG